MLAFKCDKCGYKTDRKSDLQKHLKSKKHHKITNTCFQCKKQFKYPSELKRHGLCNKVINNDISGNNNNGFADSNANITDSPNATAMNIVGDYANAKIYHINLFNYTGDKFKFLKDLTGISVPCFDSEDGINELNKEFDILLDEFKKAYESFDNMRSEIYVDYYDKFVSALYKRKYHENNEEQKEDCNDEDEPYEDESIEESSVYKLTDADYEKLKSYVDIINNFDKLICYIHDEDKPRYVFEPKLNSHKNLKYILFRVAPNLLNSVDIESIIIDVLNNDPEYNKNVANNLINNLAIKSIYRVLNNKERMIHSNMVNVSKNIYFKSDYNNKNDLQQLTYNVIAILFKNMKTLLEIANDAFPDIEFTDKNVNIDFIRSKISEFVPDITPKRF